MEWIRELGFIPLGFAVGAIGTLLGAGGGFLVAPLLLHQAWPAAILVGDFGDRTAAGLNAVVDLVADGLGHTGYGERSQLGFRIGHRFDSSPSNRPSNRQHRVPSAAARPSGDDERIGHHCLAWPFFMLVTCSSRHARRSHRRAALRVKHPSQFFSNFYFEFAFSDSKVFSF